MHIILAFALILGVTLFLTILLPVMFQDSPLLSCLVTLLPVCVAYLGVSLEWVAVCLFSLILFLPFIFYNPHRQR